jgi:hypothetical protein
MTSTHVRYGAFFLLLLTGILAAGDITKVFPFLPPNYATLVVIVIVALKEFLIEQVTPSTNANTPDNKPSAPMPPVSLILVALLCLVAFGNVACTAPTSTNPTVVQLENPNNQAKITQGAVQGLAGLFLNRNPGYKNELKAAGDTLLALAASNPATLTGADVSAYLGNTSLSGVTQNEISNEVTGALAVYEAAFNFSFPTVKVNYAIFLDAVANGLYAASGYAASEIALPVIPWPPVAASPAAYFRRVPSMARDLQLAYR